jgi:hypothetical protein
VKFYVKQSEPGPCVNCRGHGRVDVDTYYGFGDEDADDREECYLCCGTGQLSAEQIAVYGWGASPGGAG